LGFLTGRRTYALAADAIGAPSTVKHPRRRDRTLQLPEVIEAPDHERKTLRLRDQLVDRQRFSGENGEGLIARIGPRTPAENGRSVNRAVYPVYARSLWLSVGSV
jgi:hypothetical protein